MLDLGGVVAEMHADVGWNGMGWDGMGGAISRVPILVADQHDFVSAKFLFSGPIGRVFSFAWRHTLLFSDARRKMLR